MEANKQSFNAPEIKLHFLDYWRIIRIRKTVILAVFLLVAITTTLVTFILPESFGSTVRIKVEKDNSDIIGMSERGGAGGFDPYWVQDQFETLQSKLILHQVISNLNLTKKWAELYKQEGELPMQDTYQMLKGQTDVRQSRNTSLIEIKVYNRDPKEAAQIANEIAKVYKYTRLHVRRDYLDNGIKELELQYEKHVSAISNRQSEVSALKSDLGISDIDANGTGSSLTLEPEQLRKLEAERITVQSGFKKIDTLYTSLANLSRAELKKSIPVASPDSILGLLLENQNQAEQKFSELGENYGADHPDVKKVRRVLGEINRQIDDRLDGILNGLKVQRDAELARLVEMASLVEKSKTNDIQVSIKQRPYFQAKRELENMLVMRDQMAKKILQERVDASLPRSGIVEIIDKAESSNKAERPRKTVNIALGVIFGLAIGVGLAFFIEYLDTSVKTIDDVERALQAPVLGVIPQNVGALVDEGPDSPHAEAYRVLRTNIMFSQKDAKLNTITIVSGGAGEGKSTTTFNLATIFAQNGSRVLVVDSDLRRPSLHKILKVTNAIGLTNFLLKQNSLEEVIQTTPIPTLDFLPSGKLPSSSMGVLSSAQMKELIRDLKRRYDYVFFDSPPIMGVSDASILASEVDIVLQVIQYRRYPQPMTIRAKQMIEKVGGNLLGIVLNNINMASDENYYYYSGYYYDYYSRQDDDSESTDKPKSSSKKTGEEEEKVEIKPKY